MSRAFISSKATDCKPPAIPKLNSFIGIKDSDPKDSLRNI